jgi:hypothetical protein
MPSGNALALLLIAWALLSSKSTPAAVPAAPPAPPAPKGPPPQIESRSPGVPQRSTGTPQRATRQPWSIDTMRLFAREMSRAGVDPRIVLQGIAAASDFDPGFFLGDHVGLLAVRRQHLREIDFPADRELYSMTADEQIPWIGKVIAYRIASAEEPEDVSDLAVILNPVPAKMEPLLRGEAKRRAADAERTRYYQTHATLLKRAQMEE